MILKHVAFSPVLLCWLLLFEAIYPPYRGHIVGKREIQKTEPDPFQYNLTYIKLGKTVCYDPYIMEY